VTVPVSSLRSEAFGNSGLAQVLKSATAATRDGPEGPAAGGAAGAGFCSSVVAGLAVDPAPGAQHGSDRAVGEGRGVAVDRDGDTNRFGRQEREVGIEDVS